jgi:DNA polymerase-3 subunit epsilon
MVAFAAIDFETANIYRHSACAIGVTIVDRQRIISSDAYLIRPTSKWFKFTDIHGLTWDDVRDAPEFDEIWSELLPEIKHVDFLAAHNASFDRGVLSACCDYYSVRKFRKDFVCTMSLARNQWSIYPTRLPDVCSELNINLNHHEAGSDARACAKIVIHAQKNGWSFR